MTAADLIRSNSGLQEGFAQREVLSLRQEMPQDNGHSRAQAPLATTNIISGLLDLALAPSSLYSFDIRLSACECLKAYLFGHAAIRLHFLRRAVEGQTEKRQEPDNIITILIDDPEAVRGVDPYRPWISSVLLFHLLYEDFDAKHLAMSVAEGDARNGEEVITCIQALSANLISGEQKGVDPRVSIGYLMILCGWLYEDHDAVNDFLGEGSNVQSIVQLVTQKSLSQVLVSGLCAFFLGVVYEFSTKDSPISRETLHQILTTRLGRELYVDRITKLREHPMVRDFEVLHQVYGSGQPGSLPEVYFDKTFMDFLKDNFSRVIRAIDRPPGIEVAVVANGIQKGVSRELVDSLKSRVDAAEQTIQKLESEKVNAERKLAQEQADHRKAKDSATVELNRIRNINEALQRNHEEDMHRTIQEQQRTLAERQESHEASTQSLQDEMQRAREDADAAATRFRVRNDAEINDLQNTIRLLRSELEKANKEHVQDLQTAHEDYSTKLSELQSRLQRAEDKANEAEIRATRLQRDLDNKEEARKSAQTELDDMLMVLGDLEEKRSRDKVWLWLWPQRRLFYSDLKQTRLRTLGGEVSDAETENEDAEHAEFGISKEDDEISNQSSP